MRMWKAPAVLPLLAAAAVAASASEAGGTTPWLTQWNDADAFPALAMPDEARRLRRSGGASAVAAFTPADYACDEECQVLLAGYEAAKADEVQCLSAQGRVLPRCQDLNVAFVTSFTGSQPLGFTQAVGVLKMVEYINTNQELMRGYRLRIDFMDSGSGVDKAMDAIGSLVGRRDRYIALMSMDPFSSMVAIQYQYARNLGMMTIIQTQLDSVQDIQRYPDVVNVYLKGIGIMVDGAVGIADAVGWNRLSVVVDTTFGGSFSGSDSGAVSAFQLYLEAKKQAGLLDDYEVQTVFPMQTWSQGSGVFGQILGLRHRVLLFAVPAETYAYIMCEFYRANRRTGFVAVVPMLPVEWLDPTLAAQSDARTLNGCTAAQVASVTAGQVFMARPYGWLWGGVPAPDRPLSCNPQGVSETAMADIMQVPAQMDQWANAASRGRRMRGAAATTTTPAARGSGGGDDAAAATTTTPAAPRGGGGGDDAAAATTTTPAATTTTPLASSHFPATPFMQPSFYALGADGFCFFTMTVSELIAEGNLTVDELPVPTTEVKDMVIQRMRSTTFMQGIQGPIWMAGGTSPETRLSVAQVQNGQWATIGYYLPGTQRLAVFRGLQPIQWYTGSSGMESAPTDLFPECPIGEIVHGDGCRPCGVGEVYLETRSRCICGPGYKPAQAEDGQATCEPCEVGTYTSQSGALECTACLPGMFNNLTAQTSCLSCPAGTYQPEAGQSNCTDCAATFSSWPGAISASECTCDEGKLFMRESSEAAPSCIECPKGLQCPGGNSQPLTAARYSAFFTGGVAPFEGAAPDVLVKCLNTHNCPGGFGMNACPANRHLIPACNACELGYTERDGECISCTDVNQAGPMALAAIAAIAVVIGLFIYAKRDSGVKPQTLITITISGGLILNTMQVLGAFREIVIDWPDPLKTILHFTEVFAFRVELLNVGCIFNVNKPETTYLGSILVFPVFALFTLAFFWVMNLLPIMKQKVTLYSATNTLGLIALSFYTSLSLVAVMPWQCENNPDGTASVVLERGVRCWESDEHTAMLAMSCFAILAYIGVFFSMLTWATWVYPNKVCREGGITFLRRFHFLFDRFSPQHYYFGLAYCFRNLLVTLVPVFFANEIAMQLLLMCLLFATYIACEARIWPWRSPLPNYLDAIICVSFLVILIGGTLVLEVDDGNTFQIVSNFFIAVTAITTVAVLSVLLYSVSRIVFPKKRYAAFISHHKVGAAVLARWMKMELQALTAQEAFLDSDNLKSLDFLFEAVSHQSRHIIVLMTRQLLERIWCAGEIAIAVRHNISMVRVRCDDYEEPRDDFIDKLDRVWARDQLNEVARMGVELHHIQAAYKAFRDLPFKEFDRSAPLVKQNTDILDIFSSLKLLSAAARLKAEQSKGAASASYSAKVLVTGDSSSPEHTVTMLILQRSLQRELEVTTAVLSSEPAAAQQQVGSAAVLLVMLTSGVLERPEIVSATVSAFELRKGLMPVMTDRTFMFPSPAFFADLEADRVLAPGVLEELGLDHPRVVAAYKALFTSIAPSLSPHGSQELLSVEFKEIAARCKRDALFTKDGLASMSHASTSRDRHGGMGKRTSGGSAEGPNEANFMDPDEITKIDDEFVDGNAPTMSV